ncbi:trehalose corynomycolate mycolyl acetyltransferase TmaT [soil metagenome]
MSTGSGSPSEGGDDRPKRFPLLEPLRAIAAISILLVHVAIFAEAFDDALYGRLVAHLDIGVPFFFLLSAFLLYRPFLVARVEAGRSRSLRTYARRRFWRIAPAYWAALTISAIVPGMAGAFSGNWWVYYGLLQDFPIYTPTGLCAIDGFRCALPTTWSLAVEVLFYLMLPLLVLATARLGKGFPKRHWLSIELGFVAVLTLISVAIQSSKIDTDVERWLFYSPLGRGWWFGLGLGLAALSVAAEQRADGKVSAWFRRNPGPPVALAAVLYVVACEWLLTPSPSLGFNIGTETTSAYVGGYLLFGLIPALLMLPIAFTPDAREGFYRRILSHRWLAWLGSISYGIFLWQIPVLIGLLDIHAASALPIPVFPALLVMTLAVTIACAALSFYLLERPLMRRFRGDRAVLDPNDPAAVAP